MWRAVVSQPLDRTKSLPQLGALDEEMGEFWVGNAFSMPANGDNLSAFERNRLFLNDGQGQPFLDASFASGADIDSDSRSVIAADFDRDGRTDLLVASVGGGPLRLFLNRLASENSRVSVRIADTSPHKSLDGVHLDIRSGGQRIVRDCFAANGCLGQAPAELLVGLGEASRIDLLSIRWPDGTTADYEDLPVNGELVIHSPSKIEFNRLWPSE